jgi:hypothetical protein
VRSRLIVRGQRLSRWLDKKSKLYPEIFFFLPLIIGLLFFFLIPLVEYVAPLWVVNSVALGFYLLLTIIYFLISLRVLPILSKKYKDL